MGVLCVHNFGKGIPAFADQLAVRSNEKSFLKTKMNLTPSLIKKNKRSRGKGESSISEITSSANESASELEEGYRGECAAISESADTENHSSVTRSSSSNTHSNLSVPHNHSHNHNCNLDRNHLHIHVPNNDAESTACDEHVYKRPPLIRSKPSFFITANYQKKREDRESTPGIQVTSSGANETDAAASSMAQLIEDSAKSAGSPSSVRSQPSKDHH